MIKRFRQGGITIIELMATLAVVGVMVAFGLTSFLENRARQQVTTALSGLDTVRDAAQKWAASERLTPDTGWIAQGQTVSLDLLGGVATLERAQHLDPASLTLTNTDSILTLSVVLKDVHSKINGQRIGLRGAIQGDSSIRWICVTQVPSSHYAFLPARCHNDLANANPNTVVIAE